MWVNDQIFYLLYAGVHLIRDYGHPDKTGVHPINMDPMDRIWSINRDFKMDENCSDQRVTLEWQVEFYISIISIYKLGESMVLDMVPISYPQFGERIADHCRGLEIIVEDCRSL